MAFFGTPSQGLPANSKPCVRFQRIVLRAATPRRYVAAEGLNNITPAFSGDSKSGLATSCVRFGYRVGALTWPVTADGPSSAESPVSQARCRYMRYSCSERA
eukprot:scaffold118856_cov69-Phaeocystis_antarctica.AAC.2